MAFHLLGRHINGGSDHRAGFGDALVGAIAPRRSRDSKVHNLAEVGVAVAFDQRDIVRFEIAVNNIQCVCCCEAIGNLSADLRHKLCRQGPALVEEVLERDALQILHDKVAAAVIEFTKVRNVDHMGAVNGGRGTRLQDKAFGQQAVDGQFLVQDFHGTMTLKGVVLC